MQEFIIRFKSIWRPNFLKNNLENINSNKTWHFWFLTNTIFAIIFSIVVAVAVVGTINKFADNFKAKYPDARVALQDGKLSLEGIQEPIFYKDNKTSVFVVDTKEIKYNDSILNDYQEGMFITENKIIQKKSEFEKREYDFSQIKQNFVLTQNNLQDFKDKFELVIILVMFMGLWMYFNIFRLVSGLFWALLFWILALVMSIKQITFSKTYFAVLNLYIIPLMITTVLFLLGVAMPFITFVIFLIIFILNYQTLKKSEHLETKIEQENIETK